MRLFMALRTLPLGPEYDDERTLATMKLMEYFKATDRIEQYIEYVGFPLFLYHLCLIHFKTQIGMFISCVKSTCQ